MMENKPVSDNQTRFSAEEEWDEEELEAAGLGSRMINYLFDLLGIGLLANGVTLAMTELGYGALLTDENNNLLMGYPLIITYYCVNITYYCVLEGLTSRTLGKFITGTYVVTADGLKPGFLTILGRTLCRYIPFEPLSFLFGSLGFHDRFSNTRVVRNQPTAPAED
jgi:uncharacterized RDD family membrane protein YckC